VIRLNKLLSQAGVASRRVADDLISQGRVELNGHVVTELGTKADPARDTIRVDGRRVGKVAPQRHAFVLYKPRGVVSTRSDPQRRTTVIDLLRRAGIEGYFYPVGRLDYDSEGVMIVTNDGDLAERLMHPRYELERTYQARVLGTPDERDLKRLGSGLLIDGRRTLPAKVSARGQQTSGGETHTVLEIVLREGRNRQVRRMCEAIGHPIVELKRTRFGPIGLKGLKAGDIRELAPAEIAALRGGDDRASSRQPAARRR
jgi:pseudouridine synthase